LHRSSPQKGADLLLPVRPVRRAAIRTNLRLDCDRGNVLKELQTDFVAEFGTGAIADLAGTRDEPVLQIKLLADRHAIIHLDSQSAAGYIFEERSPERLNLASRTDSEDIHKSEPWCGLTRVPPFVLTHRFVVQKPYRQNAIVFIWRAGIIKPGSDFPEWQPGAVAVT
jgi:hypothetical protein